MATKEVVEEIIDSYLKDNGRDKLLINYKGFIGRGINGVMSKSMALAYNFNNEYDIVINHVKQYDGDEEKTVLLEYELKEKYLIAKYQDYKKCRFDRKGEFTRDGKEYSVIVPYSSIESVEIIHDSVSC